MRTFEEREKAYEESKKGKNVSPIRKMQWLIADHIVDQVYCDKLNGLSNSEIQLKLVNCKYDGQKRKISERAAFDYIWAARDRLRYDFQEDMKDLRSELYGKMLAVYNDAMIKNDRYNAIGALNSIMKLTGIDKQTPNTQINIQNNSDSIKISFGFNNDDEDNKVEDVDEGEYIEVE